MNATLQKHFFQLRFLLHGCPEHYSNPEQLYLASHSNSVWSRVADKVLEKWRVISPALAERIPPHLWNEFNIHEISSQRLIADLAPGSLTGEDLPDASEREEVLNQISLHPDHEALWKSLALHEANDGKLVTITEATYRENLAFPLSPELRPHITIISQTNRPEWIPLWTPEAAIEIMLSQPSPQQFCKPILRLISKAPEILSDQQLLEQIKTTDWLSLTTRRAIAPKQVVLLPNYLQSLEQSLKQLFQSEDSPYVSRGTLGFQVDQEVLNPICTIWYENNVLEFLLTETRQPSQQVLLILSLLKIFEQRRQTISNINVESLKNTMWLVDCNGQTRSPQQVIHRPTLQVEATRILEKLRVWNYVTPNLLQTDLDIRFCLDHPHLQALFISGEEAIERIGEAINQLPEYYLGDLPINQTLLKRFIQVFHDCELMPVLSLSKGMTVDEFEVFILPQASKPIRDTERLCSILNWLIENYSSPQPAVVEVYNYYLKLACCSQEAFGTNVLSHIQLLNQIGEWDSPENLCDGDRYTGIEPASVLDGSQREILNFWLDQRPTGIITHSTLSISPVTSTKAVETNAQQLEKYFHHWLSYLPSEEIGGFLCLLTGTDADIQQLAQTYLQSRSFDGLRERLLWSEDLRRRNFTVKVKTPEDSFQAVENLLGNSLNVNIQRNRIPEHLFVGEFDHLTTELTLRSFQQQDSQSLSKVILASATILIEKIYKTKTEPLAEVWQDLSNSQRIYVNSARAYIFKNLPFILRMLGVQNQSIKDCLRQLEKSDQELHELDLRSDGRARERRVQVSKSSKIAKEDLHRLIETNTSAISDVLQAVRKKIGQGQYGYSVSSIPFELFQNADDSLAELEMMLDRKLPERSHYVLNWNTNHLTVMHWGRPINLATHADVPNKIFEDAGFNRDLHKMLNFNISDKTEGETGKFGLGFKTVHLISQEPCIISGDLNFTIQAGLLPFALPRPGHQEADEERVHRLKQLQQTASKITGGTLIDLPLDSNTTAEQIVREFGQQAALLLVFAKCIKTCQLTDRSTSTETLSWSPTTVLGIEGVEYGTIRLPNDSDQWQVHKLLRFHLPFGDVAIILPDNRLQSSSPLKQLPTFWVTAPTKESLNLRFVVNGAFDITTGRTSLDRNSNHNQDLIKRIGENLGEKLCELFRLTEGNWSSFSESLDLEKVDAYTFWEFLWDVLAVDWLNRNGDSTTNQLLQEGLGGDYCGMGILIASHAALPNGLWDQARRLVRLERVTHQLEGLLINHTIFGQVATWEQFNQNYSVDRLVHHTVWQTVKKLLGTDITTPESLKLVDVLSKELGDRRITPDTANQLGQLITPEKLREWKVSHRLEQDDISSMLVDKTIYFESEDNRQYTPACQLLVRSHANSLEEKRLAAFAPCRNLLHSAYTGNALQFFLSCREQRNTVSTEKLIEWALDSNTDTQRQAVLNYLVSGEHKAAFALYLEEAFIGTWMENYPGIRETLEINAQQMQAERASKGEIDWNQVTNHVGSEVNRTGNESEPSSVTESRTENSDELLHDLFNWWQANHQSKTQQYNECLYPFKVEEMQQKLRNRDRSAWLMLLFLGMTHRMGRTRHEQHRNFIRFCLDRDWWQQFSSPNPRSSPDQWMRVLNEYMEEQIEYTGWYYWIEKFPSIYRIASYLNAYTDSFLSIEKSQDDFDLNLITSPRSNPAFQGGGADAPPLPLGIGANFIIRELVRLEVVQPISNAYVHLHCFVPRANVRRLLTHLGCQDLNKPDHRSSGKIYQFLKTEFMRSGLLDEPTFNNCFDIPFELYAENSSKVDLRNIQVRDDVDWYESISDEEHSQYEVSREDEGFATLSNGQVIPSSWMS